ncbi:MAG: exodeoxyribonuclease V subunit gamma [Methylococcaceae bacterium]|nr:exodeoxyribonuclease V subunit gamma [Methylococcaceae bacterium]
MFILHSSNKTENLLVHLTTVIENFSLSQALSKEVFLIQSQGMERWLSQQLASYFGVWGNYEFLFPGKFFSSIAGKIDNRINDDVFDRELMLWRFELLLRQLDDDCFTPLKHYLSGENLELKRYQLATQLAQIFDQYQMMRPDMLELWQQGQLLYQVDSEHWQRALWHLVTQSIGSKHRGSLWQDVIKKLNHADEGVLSKQLPERIFVFGLNTMPPLFLDYLQGLSLHCDIHLFLLNPAQVYWADFINKKQIAEAPEGHPLLSTLGQQGREFQQMLLEQADFAYEPDSFEWSEASNNLQQLQNDILNNQLQGLSLEKDNSISIHACHSRMREVEVLKDQLLSALEQDTELELREMVVMAPDIQLYAPFISAVFSDIQHSIADRSLRLSNTVLNAFIRFLRLSQSRFGWQSVMDLLEQPVVFANFSLSESDIELIKHWVLETHVRWGKSATHKKELGLPELNENTWQAALDRLLMGYAVGSEESFVDNILPYREIEGSTALVLGGFNDFIQLLFKASNDLKQQATLSNWGNRLYYYADQLICADTQTEQIQRQQLNEIIEQLAVKIAAQHTEDISLDVIIAWLENSMSESKSSNGFLRGQLTFCSMLPMRSIPFKVIALIGLNEGEFPKIDRHPSFDLIGQNFRKGDRSRRADDRYQFLEVLLSARQQLIITFQGLSIQHNEDIPPSVIISELLGILENHYQLTDLITKHPLQAFSQRYFNDEEELFSYSQSAYETAVTLQTDKEKTELWWQGTLEAKDTETIDINELFAFYRQPQQYFLQRQLGIRFTGLSADVEEREPFAIDTLDAYTINQQWIEHVLNGTPYTLKKLQAQGLWLSGIRGEQAFEQQQQAINQFADLIQQLNLGQRQEDQPIDIIVGGYRLLGKLSQIYEQGSLLYRYASIKGKDFMQAWLHHLIINHIQPQDTHLLSLDESLVFSLDAAESSDNLNALIKIFIQGQQQPDAFFTESAFAYVKQALKLKTSKRAKTPAIISAQEQLKKEIGYDRSLQQLYQNVEDLSVVLNADFEEKCNELVLPIWEALKGE